MKILTLTVAFLMLLMVITASHSKQLMHSAFCQKMHTSLVQNAQFAQIAREKALLQDLRDEVTDKGEGGGNGLNDQKKGRKKKDPSDPPAPPSAKAAKKLNFSLMRIPDNARINFKLLLEESKEKQPDPLSLYEIAASLMRTLYGNQNFFTEVPEAEYRILDKLIENKERCTNFTSPDELSSIDLGDEKLQKIFYIMFKGSPSFDEHRPGFPSLLFFITFDQAHGNRKKINLLFCPKPILSAIFKNEAIVSAISAFQASILQEMLEFEKNRLKQPNQEPLNRTKFSEDIVSRAGTIFNQFGLDKVVYNKFFDVTVGSMGNILIIQDLKTGMIQRLMVQAAKNVTKQANKT